MALGISGALPSGTNLVIDGGVLGMGSLSQSVNGVSLQGGGIGGTGVLTSSTLLDMQSGSVSADLAGNVGLSEEHRRHSDALRR